MAYQALAATERFGAAVIGAGLSDCVDLLERRPKLGPAVFAEVIPEWSTDREGALLRRSPVRWADRLCATTPILMMHSNADQRVHPSQALHMAEALLAAGVPHRLVMFEDGDHLLGRHRDEVLALSAAWLDRWLDGDGAE
jgi:dipeptidyl aminopeptidase/acylaminoacyl peptidase